MKENQNVPARRFPGFEGAWERKKLGEVATFINGKAFKQEELLSAGKYPVLRVGNFFSSSNWYYSDLELEPNKYCDWGDLLFAWSASFGPKVWDGNKTIYHYHIWKIECSLFVDKKYLFYLLDEQTLKMKTNSSNGFALLHITKGTIENWTIPLPTLPEQQKIATFFTTIDQKISQLKQKKNLLEQYKKGAMQALFAQQLRFRADDGSDFPDWEEKVGGEVFSSISDKNHNSDLPILAITQEHGAIPREMIDFQISVTDRSVETYKVVQIGDFIISLRSFQGGIEYSEYKGICSPAYVVLRPKIELNRTFFKFYLKTSSYITELNKKLEGIRDGKMISYQYFSEIPLPFPSLPEQQKIATFLSRLDERIALVAQQIAATEQWKKGLLQQMFC